jgi:hypothetical protein
MAYVGTYSRYLADDYCTAGILRSAGFWEGLLYWYQTWSGRISFFFLIQMVQLLGPGVTPYATGIALGLWFLTAYLLLAHLSRVIGLGITKVLAATVAAVLVMATALGAPDRYQSFYWLTGLATYVAPLVLMTLLWTILVATAGSSLPPRELVAAGAACFLLAFAVGGFSEVAVGAELALLVMALPLAAISHRTGPRHGNLVPLAAALAGTIAAIAVLVLAPGNEARLALMPGRVGLASTLLSSAGYALVFSAKAFLRAPGPLVLAVVIPLTIALDRVPAGDWLAGQGPRFRIIMGVWIVSMPFLAIVASLFPAVYVTSAYPAERALVVAQYLLVWGLAVLGYACGMFLKGRRWWRPIRWSPSSAAVAQWTAVGFVLIVSLAAAKDALAFVPEARSFSDQWDARNARILGAIDPGTEMAVAPLPHMAGLAEVGQDPSEWINACVAMAYGLRRVVAK